MGLLSLACWGSGFESQRGRGYLSLVCCVLSGTGLCFGLITRPEVSYRVWSWSLDNNLLTPELNPSAQRCLPGFLLRILIFKGFTARRLYKALAHYQLSGHEKYTDIPGHMLLTVQKVYDTFNIQISKIRSTKHHSYIIYPGIDKCELTHALHVTQSYWRERNH
jgi:hypothetical protein